MMEKTFEIIFHRAKEFCRDETDRTHMESALEIAKKLIGQETELIPHIYPVEYEPIRRWCQMVEDDNPLFLNPEYAKKTKYEEVVCPPFAITLFSGRSPGYFPPPPPATSVIAGVHYSGLE